VSTCLPGPIALSLCHLGKTTQASDVVLFDGNVITDLDFSLYLSCQYSALLRLTFNLLHADHRYQPSHLYFARYPWPGACGGGPAFSKYLFYYSDVLDFRLLSFPLLLSLPDLRSGICPLYKNCRLSITDRLPPLSGNMCFII